MSNRRKQEGVTLFVALIMLVMVTLLAVSSFKVSNTNLKVVSSMQGRSESIAATQAAIEQVISNGTFTTSPATIAANPIPIDLNGDNTADYQVQFSPQPTCIRSRDTPSTSLDPLNPNDRGCFGSSRYGSPTSNCADTIWEVAGVTTDTVTAARTIIRQGVSLRLDKATAQSTCS